MKNIPVVILIYNRPYLIMRVMEKISEAKPEKLFVIADGPREDVPDDKEKCQAARETVLGSINWKCDVSTNFAEGNMGLRHRVSSGITWAFKEVDCAIILEDDCVPDISFFYFCEELLEKYENDNRVMVVSGDNYLRDKFRTSYSYYFSRYNHCWGWATWRRAWKLYDDNMTIWPELRNGGWLLDILQDKAAAKYWDAIFQNVYEGKTNSWAYRWTFSCWAQSGLTILPNKNLVVNIGMGENATNTLIRGFRRKQDVYPIELPLSHPPFVIRDEKADSFIQKYHFGSGLYKQIKRQIAKFLVTARLMR